MAVIKPDAYERIGQILDSILSNGFTLSRLVMAKLSLDQAAEFYHSDLSSQQAA